MEKVLGFFQKARCLFGWHDWQNIETMYYEGRETERLCSVCRRWERGPRYYREHIVGFLRCTGAYCDHEMEAW